MYRFAICIFEGIWVLQIHRCVKKNYKFYYCTLNHLQDDTNYDGGNYSGVCTHMYCYNPSSYRCEPYPANDGVPCGDGSVCKLIILRNKQSL